MQKQMKQYAVTDAEAGYKCLIEAAGKLCLPAANFARCARSEKLNKPFSGPFLSGGMQRLARQLLHDGPTEAQERYFRSVRQNHERGDGAQRRAP